MPTGQGKQGHRSAIIIRAHWDTGQKGTVCYQKWNVKSAQRKDGAVVGNSTLQTSAGSPNWLTAECLTNRSLTCFANSSVSQRRKCPQGTVILYSLLANQEELVGISTALGNLGGRHHIISEFMIGWEDKDSHIYNNSFSRSPNNLEVLDMRSWERKLYQLLKIQFWLFNIKQSKGEQKVGGT